MTPARSSIAVRAFTLVAAGVALFQLALTAGAPWGELAWGGAFAGRLPPRMRLASAASALLLVGMVLVVRGRAGLMGPAWLPAARKLVWVVVAQCAFSVVVNAIAANPWERMLWLPVSALLFAASWVVARSQ